jgi:argininosuccinate lyase
MAKLWTGRFKKQADERTSDFNSSISFDARMAREDIAGSMAHAAMLKKQGIISGASAANIARGLSGILADLEDGTLQIDPTAEDIHSFVEAELTARIGEDGKRLHTARSRNDQVALDIRLHLRSEVAEVKALIKNLLSVLCDLSDEHLETVMPGYTHMQRAQPVTLAHHLMAYAQMLLRDTGRLSDAACRMDEMPLGSGALAGTTYDIDRGAVASALSFSRITANSLDAVSDRDFCIEIASALAVLMMHLSRLSEEIILWCSWEFRFIELDDSFSTGSSIMPQKKNPDICELIRGKAGRVIGDVVTLLTMMKGLPLAYNKDMQEDKEAVFDALDTAKLCLSTIAPMLQTMTVHKAAMRAAASEGFMGATDCADYLTKKGVPFREAYRITGELVALCIETGKTLETLELSAYKKLSDVFDEDIYTAVALETCLAGRAVYGGPAPQAVKAQIIAVRQAMEVMQ